MNAMTPAATRTPVVDQIFGANHAPIAEVLKADFADLMARVDDMVDRGEGLPRTVTTEQQHLEIGRYIVDARTVAKDAEALRSAEKAPMLAATRELDAFFKGLVDQLANAVRPLQAAADNYVARIEAEKREAARREAEAARAKAAEEERKAEEARRADHAARAAGRAEELHAKADEAEARALASSADLTRTRGDGVTASGKTTIAWEFTDKAALFESLGPLGTFMAEPAVTSAINSMVRVQKMRTQLPGIRVFEKAVSNFRGR